MALTAGAIAVGEAVHHFRGAEESLLFSGIDEIGLNGLFKNEWLNWNEPKTPAGLDVQEAPKLYTPDYRFNVASPPESCGLLSRILPLPGRAWSGS